MDIDVEGQLRAVTRSVELVSIDGQPGGAVGLARSFATSAEELWDAVTNIERIPSWFTPLTGDLELGGRYQLEGNAGGTITTCEPPTLFEVTWEFAGDVSWVTVSLSAVGRG